MALTANVRGQEKRGRELKRVSANLNTTRFPRPRDSSVPRDNDRTHGQWRLVAFPFSGNYIRGSVTRLEPPIEMGGKDSHLPTRTIGVYHRAVYHAVAPLDMHRELLWPLVIRLSRSLTAIQSVPTQALFDVNGSPSSSIGR